jgi:hypothetical protein
LGGEGEAGKPNLYLHEAAGGTRLVATLYAGSSRLPGGDLSITFPHFPFSVAQTEPLASGVRMTADGSHLAFASAESVTGYDNKDAVDGQPDLELYLYDVESGKVHCISCNPSGARPAGREFEGTHANLRRVSAQMAAAQNDLSVPRALSENGNRLFFESYESLLPGDTNGKEDVYEWERAASQKECEGIGAELFVPSAVGCLSLISSGQSPTDSEFADATPDGSNVFIRTASSLLPQDPGLIDIYDAREGGGFPQPSLTSSCEGEACQGPAAPPNDPTPASAAFNGAGNVKEVPARKKHKKKQTSKHQKKKHTKKRANHHGRTGR